MSNRLKELREARGISQTKLAELLGTNKVQISRIENGKRRLSDDWVWRIAQVLQVHPGELFEPVPRELDQRSEALVDLFVTLPEGQKSALLQLAESMAAPYKPADHAPEAGKHKSSA